MSANTERRHLYLIRGLPGSGKSTLAASLAPTVCEADAFFVGADGVFRFDRARVPAAHRDCQMRTHLLMMANTSPIAVANVFVTRAALAAYYALAKTYGYETTEITLSGPVRANVHGVPEAAIAEMRAAWEV